MKHLLLFILVCLTLRGYNQTATKFIYHNGVQRQYYIHFPPGFSNGQHLPLVLNFHGLGSNGYEQEFYSGMSDVADTANFVAVYPDGISNEWNVGFSGAYATGTDDVGFVSALIDTLSLLDNIDLSRVYACGMSDGGFMSYRLACELSNRIAAIAPVSGTLSDSTAYYCNPARIMPVLHIHGTDDPLVPYNGVPGIYSAEATVQFWLAKNQCANPGDTTSFADIDIHDSSTVQRIAYNTCVTGNKVWFYKINGGGHSWPNGAVNYIYGPTNRDIKGSSEIWNFFKQYSLPLTGVDEVPAKFDLTVYPNPFTEVVQLTCEKPINKIEVWNTLGQLIYQAQGPFITTVDLKQLQPGTYILKAFSGDAVGNKVLVKE